MCGLYKLYKHPYENFLHMNIIQRLFTLSDATVSNRLTFLCQLYNIDCKIKLRQGVSFTYLRIQNRNNCVDMNSLSDLLQC